MTKEPDHTINESIRVAVAAAAEPEITNIVRLVQLAPESHRSAMVGAWLERMLSGYATNYDRLHVLRHAIQWTKRDWEAAEYKQFFELVCVAAVAEKHELLEVMRTTGEPEEVLQVLQDLLKLRETPELQLADEIRTHARGILARIDEAEAALYKKCKSPDKSIAQAALFNRLNSIRAMLLYEDYELEKELNRYNALEN